MKNLLFFALVLIAFSGKSFAQVKVVEEPMAKPSDYKNIVYAEVLGNSNFGLSANYQRLFPLNSKRQVTIVLRAGVGKIFNLDIGKSSDESYISYPAEVSVFMGRNTIKPEFGIGLTVIDDIGDYPLGVQQERIKKVLLTSLGLRLQEPGGRFFFKGGFTYGLVDISAESPDLAVWTLWTVRLLPGLSMGVRF